MKKILIALFLFGCSSLAFAQSPASLMPSQKTWLAQEAELGFPSGIIVGSNAAEIETNARLWLKSHISDLKNENTGLKLTNDVSSPYARYLTYSQTSGDYEIFGTSVKIGIDKENRIHTLIYKTAPIDNSASITNIPDPDLATLKSIAGSVDYFSWKKAVFFEYNSTQHVYVMNCAKNDGSKSDVMVLNTSYDIIYRNSLLKNYKYPDSLVTMYVFFPDPLTSAKVPYAEPYTNHNDSDVAALDSQMIPMQTRVSVVNDSFFLENKYILESDLSSPHNSYTYSKKPIFHYKRDNSSFRDIMVYFHLNRWRDHLKELGYDTLGKVQLVVDPSGEFDDNSTFEYQGGPKLWFGIGGIPDAEDADVPTHEYTHYLSWSACPGCSDKGVEREALDEGTADYFAASNSKAISTYNWQKVYNWDGNIANWHGRSVAVSDIYPAGLKAPDYHDQGQMWSSALMEIWDVMGRTKTDQLMLETLYSLGPNLTMPKAAILYIENDSMMYKGADVYTIAHYFIKRGFLPPGYLGVAPVNQQVAYRIINNRFSSEGLVSFDFAEPQTGTLSLYDITGKEIMKQDISNADHAELKSPGLAAGLYIVSVSTSGLQKSFKLVK